MRPFLAAAATLALLVGCGEDEETTTTAASTVEEPTRQGPNGELTASAIGPVGIGATEDEVEASFGKPDKTEAVSFGGDPVAPQEDWVYRLPGGDVRLKFDTEDQALAAYDVYSPELATDDGIRVGDPDSLLERRYGDDLAGSPLGVHALVLSADDPGTAESPALTFAIDGGKIIAISGGDVVQPAGE